MLFCGFDLETPQDDPIHGLQPWRAKTSGATIKTFAAYVEDKSFRTAQRMPTKSTCAKMLRRAATYDHVLIGWNVMFDVAWLCAIGLENDVKNCKWMDAMLLLKRLDPWRAKDRGGVGFGLKEAVAERWPEHAGYGLGDEVTRVPETEDEWLRMLRYNLKDAMFTCLLGREYWDRLSPDERRGAIIEAQTIPDVALSYINGVYINEEALDPFDHDVKQIIAENLPIFGADMATVRSPKKLGTLLYDTWGYEPVKLSPKGNPATDKESLLKLAIQHPHDPRFKALMALRKCNTQSSKFIESVRKSIAYHGAPVTRPTPNMSGTYTGRFSYGSFLGKGVKRVQTGIALHQWERGKTARNLLTAPPGFLLAEFDFSGQEMRLMAIESEDETMLDLFANNGDGHAFMGASIENMDYNFVREQAETDERAKQARYLGKFANLSLQYRVGIDTMMVRALTQYNLQLWRQKAQHIKNTYLRTYPGVPRYWKEAIRQASKDGYAFTRGHRHVPLPDLNIYEQQQTAINFRIQGTGGDMKSLAICVCSEFFDPDMVYAWDLHDALFMYVRDDEYAVLKVKNLKEILSNLPYKKAWGWEPQIPLPVDAKIGKTWGSLKGV